MSRTTTPASAADTSVTGAGQGALGTVLAYSGLALVWGSSFLLIKIALDLFSPLQVAVGRIWLGAAALGLIMALTRTRWPRRMRLWAHLTVVGALLCVVPFVLFAWAGQYLPSGLSAVLNATTPIWTALAVAAGVRGERLGVRQFAGIALGLVGVAVVLGLWRVWDGSATLTGSLPAQGACLAATACYGAGFAHLRRCSPMVRAHRPLAVAAVQVTSAAGLALLLAPVVVTSPMHLAGDGQDVLTHGLPAVGSLVVLGAVGTGLAYVWNARVIAQWGSVAASSVTYLTPVVGLVAGVLVLGEQVRWNAPVGAVVVVVSVLLVQGRRLALPRFVGQRTSAVQAPSVAAGETTPRV